MMTLQVEVEGDVRLHMEQEAAALRLGSVRAIRRQTQETLRASRAVVAVGLPGTRAASTIRSRFYPDTPAGFVYSSWGYFSGGRFVDILAAHERGGTIRPRKGGTMFIPFNAKGRGGPGQRFIGKVDLIPTKKGLLVVTRPGGGRRGVALGILVRQITLRKRLDFDGVERAAETGLVQKLVQDIETESNRGVQANRGGAGG